MNLTDIPRSQRREQIRRNMRLGQRDSRFDFLSTQKISAARRFLRDTIAPLMAHYKQECEARSYRAAKQAAKDILEVLQDRVSYLPLKVSRLVAEATYRISDESPICAEYVVLADCGHFELNEETTDVHGGDHVCSDCIYNYREINGEFYRDDQCYYWESDEEYHLEPEPDEDEDEDTLASWGYDCMRKLYADTSIRSSALGDFTMGVELEVEVRRSYSRAECIDETMDDFYPPYAVLKADGSLDNGFEIVTAPRGLAKHITVFSKWDPADGLHAWNAKTCGMHVHIDSRAFSALALGKFLMFMNSDANAKFLIAIAGRHPSTSAEARHYCGLMPYAGQPAKALKVGHTSRYRMINLCNLTHEEARRLGISDHSRECKGTYSTVEIRIFRASLKPERLLAQIEFSHASVMFCRTASWGALTGKDFLTWLATNAGAYKHLAHWFGINVPKPNKKLTRACAPRGEVETEAA